MSELERLMWEAWEAVGPRLRADGDELKARLARRRSRMYQRPLRAFCLAVRACDKRITPWNAAMVPEHAVDPRCGAHPGRVLGHEVELRVDLLRKICAPVRIEPPGELWDEVAKMLGSDACGLKWLRRNGVLRVNYVKGIAGRKGKPVPLVWSPEALDPSAHGRCAPDPIWGALWTHLVDWLPEDGAWVLRREGWGEEGTEALRHEGTEWGRGGGEEGRGQFWGWRWVCPGCGRRVRTVYYPVRPPDWGEHVGMKVEEVDEAWEPPGTWACKGCHGVVNFTRSGGGMRWAWNQLVLHYTGGLMYGHEVERPGWLKVKRKVREHRKPRKAGAPRREELERWLVETDLMYKEIAVEMGVKRMTVGKEAMMLYRTRGVKGRAELKAARRKREAA